MSGLGLGIGLPLVRGVLGAAAPPAATTVMGLFFGVWYQATEGDMALAPDQWVEV